MMSDETNATIKATNITGIVRRTTSKGDTSANPATAIVTPAIGDIERAIPLANCTGTAITTVCHITEPAACGSSGEKAKKAA